MSHTIRICNGNSCAPKQSKEIFQTAQARYPNQPDIRVQYCLCLDQCEKANSIAIDDKIFNFVTPQSLQYICEKHIDRPDSLHKAGLTQDELDNILGEASNF